MIFRNISIAVLLCVTAGAALAQAPAPAPVVMAPAGAAGCVKQKLSSDSLVGDLLDNPAAKEILVKHVPELKDDEQIEMARSMSLRSLQPYAEETFSDKVLEAINSDLAKIPLCGQ